MGGCTTCLRDRELLLSSCFSASDTLTWESQQSFPPSEESPHACRPALVSRQGVGFSFNLRLLYSLWRHLISSDPRSPAVWVLPGEQKGEHRRAARGFWKVGTFPQGMGLRTARFIPLSRMQPSLFLNRKLWWNKSKDVYGAANETSACINRSINWFVFADQKKKLIASTPYSTSAAKVE